MHNLLGLLPTLNCELLTNLAGNEMKKSNVEKFVRIITRFQK